MKNPLYLFVLLATSCATSSSGVSIDSTSSGGEQATSTDVACTVNASGARVAILSLPELAAVEVAQRVTAFAFFADPQSTGATGIVVSVEAGDGFARVQCGATSFSDVLFTVR